MYLIMARCNVTNDCVHHGEALLHFNMDRDLALQTKCFRRNCRLYKMSDDVVTHLLAN